jgi:hypothetical protein
MEFACRVTYHVQKARKTFVTHPSFLALRRLIPALSIGMVRLKYVAVVDVHSRSAAKLFI